MAAPAADPGQLPGLTQHAGTVRKSDLDSGAPGNWWPHLPRRLRGRSRSSGDRLPPRAFRGGSAGRKLECAPRLACTPGPRLGKANLPSPAQLSPQRPCHCQLGAAEPGCQSPRPASWPRRPGGASKRSPPWCPAFRQSGCSQCVAGLCAASRSQPQAS